MPASGLDFFYIIRPETTKNLHTNPSIENNTTTYSAANSSTLARVSTQQRRGSYSLSVTPTSHSDGGMNTGTFTVATGGFTASFDFLGVLGINYYAQFLNSGATKIGSVVNFTGTGTWQRYEISHSGVTSVYLTIRKNNSSNTGAFFVDGVLLENKVGYSTTYVDGDQDGCFWDALAHGSTSQRYSNYRAGGRKINLSTYSAYVLDMSGVGAPPVETSIIPYGNIPGGLYQGTTVKERTMTIGVTVSGGTAAQATNADDIQMWQINMEYIFDLIKPNLVYPQQPFVLGYQHGSNDIEIDCVYAGGMDMQNEKLKSISDIAFQVQCPYPFWRQTAQKRAVMTNSAAETSGAVNLEAVYLRDTTGTLTDLTPTGSTDSFDINCIYFSPVDGKLYLAGSITKINNVTVGNGVAVYDFMTGLWSGLGTGVSGSGATVNAIVQMDNGDIIIAGSFTTANGVTTRCIARWNGSTYTIVGQANPFTVAATEIFALAIDPITRGVFVGGIFVGAGGSGAMSNYIGYFANTTGVAGAALTWSMLGGTLTVPTAGAVGVYDLKCYGKYLYFTGKWATVGAGSFIFTNNGFSRFNGATGYIEDTGIGFGAGTEGDKLAIDSGGGVYINGTFTTVNGAAIQYLSYYNNYQHVAPMTTTAPNPQSVLTSSMFLDANQQLILLAGSGYRLVGNRFVRDLIDDTPDVNFPIMNVSKENGNIILSTNTQTKTTIPAVTQVTNDGSADVYPIIKITNGNIYYIKNNTNGKSLWLRGIDVGSDYTFIATITNEIITIDCRPNGDGVSSNMREKQFQPDAASSITDFFLSPGVNYIEVLTSGSPVVEFIWTEQHWTFFGGHS